MTTCTCPSHLDRLRLVLEQREPTPCEAHPADEQPAAGHPFAGVHAALRGHTAPIDSGDAA